ncbi:hypothetical protein [Luteibacter sp. 329MFSha]|uniref:hypothetical protein n=1 Tax=Luteibacter sp. 329MFSha TaxID=1798239 RepID=UPI0008C47BE8|nr:hypothetical protein [Luteibacter sp. 329MFSha]SEW02807.1 hypothetical protein SAMN04515660_1918 [Luteibacter sp. 329MFSha]
MEFDELKAGWSALDERVAAEAPGEIAAGRDGGVRAELRPLVVGQWVQVTAGLLLAVAAGSFWFDHRHVPSLLVTGLSLHAYGVAMVVAAARNLYLAARVDDAAPVLMLQRRVAELRAWRLREGRWFGVLGCFMWVAVIVWGFALLGVDIVAARPAFVGSLLVAAVACLVVFLVVAHLKGLPEGSSLRRARSRLAEIERFERNGA